jgi:hypothetical protein
MLYVAVLYLYGCIQVGELELASQEKLDPTALLEKAIMFSKEKNFSLAAYYFDEALHTDALNEAGTSLALWRLYECQKHQRKLAQSLDTLFFFISSAQDILDLTKSNHSDVRRDAQRFIKDFELLNKVSQAHATLTAAWIKKRRRIGKTPKNPVYLQSLREQSYFINEVAPCRASGISSLHTEREGPVYKLSIYCRKRGPRYYYFKVEDEERNP